MARVSNLAWSSSRFRSPATGPTLLGAGVGSSPRRLHRHWLGPGRLTPPVGRAQLRPVLVAAATKLQRRGFGSCNSHSPVSLLWSPEEVGASAPLPQHGWRATAL